MRRSAIAVVAICGVVLGVVPLSGHHAFTPEFDGSKPVTLRGVVTKMEWVNPHSWIYIDVKGADGQVVNWALELGAPNALLRRGWRKESIPVGAEVVVQGYLARNGRPVANARTIKLTNGQEFFAGSSGTGAPVDGADATEKPK
jgi:hypothetical protein